MLLRLCRPIAALSLCCASAIGAVRTSAAQTTTDQAGATDATYSQVTLQQHMDRLQSLRQIVQGCIDEAANCSAGQVSPDEKLQLDNGVTAQVNYTWLRKQLDAFAKQSPQERAERGKTVLDRLALSFEPTVAQRDARQEANAVLHQVEFADAQPSWWDRLTARVGLWWARHFAFDDLSLSTIQSFRILLEILLFGVPLVLLVLWLLRQIREDRLVPDFARSSGERAAPSVSWVLEARACAERGAWRDAIHALYWQTIAAFEERNIWSVTRTRTPREYLALLQPGSERRKLLREQTIQLETIWYGQREATEADYRRAAHLTEELAQA